MWNELEYPFSFLRELLQWFIFCLQASLLLGFAQIFPRSKSLQTPIVNGDHLKVYGFYLRLLQADKV